jgi:hypothetical protein
VLHERLVGTLSPVTCLLQFYIHCLLSSFGFVSFCARWGHERGQRPSTLFWISMPAMRLIHSQMPSKSIPAILEVPAVVGEMRSRRGFDGLPGRTRCRGGCSLGHCGQVPTIGGPDGRGYRVARNGCSAFSSCLAAHEYSCVCQSAYLDRMKGLSWFVRGAHCRTPVIPHRDVEWSVCNGTVEDSW